MTGTTDVANADGSPKDIRVVAMNWLFNQGPAVVLLGLILLAISYGGYKAANEWIPKHIEAINQGIEKVEVKHSDDLKMILESHDRDRQAHEADRLFMRELFMNADHPKKVGVTP